MGLCVCKVFALDLVGTCSTAILGHGVVISSLKEVASCQAQVTAVVRTYNTQLGYGARLENACGHRSRVARCNSNM